VSSSRLRRPPGALALGLAVLVGVAGSTGLLVSAKDRSDNVTRVEGMEEVLEEPSNDMPAENYLLVGSDSRESVDANDPNAAAIGTAEDAVGRRSDTIMVLRRERNGGASLLSLPRDLWVPIAGTNHSSKINSAYNEGPERLAATVTQALGIPINHYVEINFEGFTKLVDEIGGVQVCTYVQAQDTHSGLNLQPGCQILDGSQALAYARSRHYEEWKDGEWQEDGRADLGRIERQQLFIRTAVKALLQKVESDPFAIGDLIGAATATISIDQNLDPVRAADALREAAEQGLQTFSLPVEGVMKGDQAALELTDEAQPILDYFRGAGPMPAPQPQPTVPG
jgi:LCP family protein required for cell wall assembly